MKWGGNIAEQPMCNVTTAIVWGIWHAYVARPEDQTLGFGEPSLMTEDRIGMLVFSQDFFLGKTHKMPSSTGLGVPGPDRRELCSQKETQNMNQGI